MNQGHLTRESFKRKSSPRDADDADIRAQNQNILGAVLGAVQKNGPIEETETAGNRIQLPNGDVGAFTLTKAHTTLQGTGLTETTRLCTCRESAILRGINFGESGDSPTQLVLLESAARVVFEGCTFERKTNGVYVQINTGAKAVFIGCVFRGTLVAIPGNVLVNNSGVLANVQIVASCNLTSLSHVNCALTANI